MGNGQFCGPSSVACFLDPHGDYGGLYDPYTPRWYLGEASVDELEMQLANEYIAGHFFIGNKPLYVQ
jgi:hypothetical protein